MDVEAFEAISKAIYCRTYFLWQTCLVHVWLIRSRDNPITELTLGLKYSILGDEMAQYIIPIILIQNFESVICASQRFLGQIPCNTWQLWCHCSSWYDVILARLLHLLVVCGETKPPHAKQKSTEWKDKTIQSKLRNIPIRGTGQERRHPVNEMVLRWGTR